MVHAGAVCVRGRPPSPKLRPRPPTHPPNRPRPCVLDPACRLLRSCFAHALVKTVKLWERPTPHELVKQLEVVLAKLPEIHASGSALNIWMERDQNQHAKHDAAADGPAVPAANGVHQISSGLAGGAMAAAAAAAAGAGVAGAR